MTLMSCSWFQISQERVADQLGMCDASRKNIKLTLFIDMHRILLPCLQFPGFCITEMMPEAAKKTAFW